MKQSYGIEKKASEQSKQKPQSGSNLNPPTVNEEFSQKESGQSGNLLSVQEFQEDLKLTTTSRPLSSPKKATLLRKGTKIPEDSKFPSAKGGKESKIMKEPNTSIKALSKTSQNKAKKNSKQDAFLPVQSSESFVEIELCEPKKDSKTTKSSEKKVIKMEPSSSSNSKDHGSKNTRLPVLTASKELTSSGVMSASSRRRRKTDSDACSYVKIKRCLHAALFITKMSKKSEYIRTYGTSCLHYNPIFKNRQYILARLRGEKFIPPTIRLPWYIIDPNNRLLIAWNLVGFVLVIYAISFMPYLMVFVAEPWVDQMEEYMTYYFMVDIVVNFTTAYFDKMHELRYDLKSIAWNYIKGFFILDLISSLPFNLFFNNVGRFS